MAGIEVVVLFMEACLAGVWLLWPWRSYRQQQGQVAPNVRRLLGWRVAGLAAMMLCPVPPFALWPEALWGGVMLWAAAFGAMTVVGTTVALHTLKSAGQHRGPAA